MDKSESHADGEPRGELSKKEGHFSLSLIVPFQKRKPPSVMSHSTASSTAEPVPRSPSGRSTMSFEQISDYARHASSSSLHLLNAGAAMFNPVSIANSIHSLDEEERSSRLQERVRRVSTGMVRTLKLSLNDSSVGLHRVMEHIHRKVPQMMDNRAQLRQLGQTVQTSNADIEDARKIVNELDQMQAFVEMANMIHKSLDIVKNTKKS
ncbi:uncharacterized protein BYT42DRAFT_605806 [Radiomyces spectabilis]|uniref:uncharacterized protein n=1 Tax=Radiomyces spectabilis TaxID=64574 RepID=UPI00221FF841|nr:uncharacterized protein BYT42DRAFT_605806 [Radiomyces spectabilis]KAI8376159.1 hypothetical protein BYT42DRAFT_605806 [Radiomyces spectabilis]